MESQIILFHKIGYVTTGKQEGGKLQTKPVKSLVWAERSAGCIAPITHFWGTVSWMPGKGFHSMQWQGGGTLPAETTLGFIYEFSRWEIQVAERL